jgi:uncharacterized protein (DUF362 family)
MQGALWMAAGGAGLLGPSRALAQALPDVAVVKGAPAAATRAAVEMLGGMKSVVKPGHKVVIKPNMSFTGGPESGTTTHPEVVRELVAMCKEAGASTVHVLDNPLRGVEVCMERSGIRDACKDLGRDMVQGLADHSFFVETAIPNGEQMTGNVVMRQVLEADVLIAAPVAKSHGGAGVSLCLKGMMGLVWDRRKMHYPLDLHTAIVDLNTLIKTHLAVIDATRVLSTNGPGGPGKVLKEDTVIASRDVVAADAQAVAMFEWWGRRVLPDNVGHIREAHRRALGRMDVDNLWVRRISV